MTHFRSGVLYLLYVVLIPHFEAVQAQHGPPTPGFQRKNTPEMADALATGINIG